MRNVAIQLLLFAYWLSNGIKPNLCYYHLPVPFRFLRENKDSPGEGKRCYNILDSHSLMHTSAQHFPSF